MHLADSVNCTYQKSESLLNWYDLCWNEIFYIIFYITGRLYSCQQSHSAVLSACSFLCTCSSQSDGEEDSCESEMVMSHLKYFEAVPSDHGSLQPVDSIQKEIKEMVSFKMNNWDTSWQFFLSLEWSEIY